MKNENLNYIKDIQDNEIVGYKIDDLVEAFQADNHPSFVRWNLEDYFNLIYRLGYVTGKNDGMREAEAMFKGRIK